MRTNNIVYSLLGLCAVLFIAVGVYIYYTNPSGDTGPANGGTNTVADTNKEDSVDHRVMKPVIPTDETKQTNDPTTGESKVDDNQPDDSATKALEAKQDANDSKNNAELKESSPSDSDNDN